MQRWEIYTSVIFCFAHLSDFLKYWANILKCECFHLHYLDLELVLKSWNIWNIGMTFQMTIVNRNWVASARSEPGKPPLVHHTP